MNATRMSKIVILLGLGFATGMPGWAIAQAPATTQPVVSLSRQDVDRLLAEARAAIESGNLKQADQLVTRAEGAKVRYPLFHFGDTPSSLRRELMRAQSTAIADPFPTAGPEMPAPTRMVDPAVTPATANSPYGNYREELPGMLPELTPANEAAPSGAATPTQYPAAQYPTAQYPTAQNPSATNDPRVQPTTQGYNAAAPNNRYANPTGMMEIPRSASQTAENTPGISDLRFAQLPGAPAPASPTTPPTPEPLPSTGAQALLEAGETALKNRDRERALELFQQANANRNDLDPSTRGRLDSHLRLLTATPEPLNVPPAATPVDTNESNFAEADGQQQVLARQLSADVGRVQTESRKIREKDPRESLRMLEEMQTQINNSSLQDDFKRQFQRRIELTINETEQYIQQNRAQLELDERNAEILAEIDRRSGLKLEMQSEIAKLVDEFNTQLEDQRYYEMEQTAQRLVELAPNEEITEQIRLTAKFVRRHQINADLADQKETSFDRAFRDVDRASVHVTSDGDEMVYDGRYWRDYVNGRSGQSDRNRRRNPKELEIEASLRTPVMMRYQNEPLAAVIDDLSKATGVNMVLDLRGLGQEGISSDTRVSLNVNSEISLKSALNLILEPLHLSYVVKDEVLKVTSEQLKDGEILTEVYDVADLVIPIPNFVPDNNIGLQGLINSAHSAMGYGAGAFGQGPMSFVNSQPEQQMEGQVPPTALAQPGVPGSGAGIGGPTTLPIGGGPGGLGGAANADFDSLIDLIISTVASDTWVENGGPEAEIRPFPTNLSLVISQTQDVHEQIADLLEQLRRLQDLQVTIEVRFIRLNDTFFERIGIDFDVNIENGSPPAGSLQPGQAFENDFPSSVVGLVDGEFPNFTNDLDIPFRQNSFGLAVPTFGTPMDVSTFGFAILSDIEAYFLINASQGDRRSNVLNAPKVTLFNGQQAFVADTSQTPFVISVVPVVGEFAAAQQPVIVVLSEGTLMTIQAVVSEDRRYVRLTVVPFFSEIGDVQEFTFEGTTSTSTSSSTTDDNGDGTNNSSDAANDIIRSGTTVQLPTFQFVSVTTTVSVPDGGTVLLGGIKRLNEGRNEFGVPLLSKVPYINRLFRNVGIGRETDSLMMMVTPRIIIQEEEEARLLGTANP